MQTVLLVIHIIISAALIGIILIQQTDSDGLSSFASNNNGSGLFSARSATNIISKITYILAGLFMLNSLILANLANKSVENESIINKIEIDSEKEMPIAE